ncbi:hypothetical protein COY59_05940 [Candidatus Gottesmanbacteria bacterium CG_4_10_14_0_8_um_filter_37_24]|nr:MAG: hypothetical protein AUJ73_02615 [Candidatus Gottesmanbacteria bacterium CG1_02_37_22]PIP32463.1 MAG: hypothetical protein COX23_04560 [Candidatus Gottesmanbacteria bacterium CG23_combo_of_CG06-09_8_20_14_all_37_19]PIZ02237.1 MAG: hypothetical protein COY59_05940 [Candidatus Gottesmanbacteria bacterium CG_4_10_14_0_8_um_filter_37_24]
MKSFLNNNSEEINSKFSSLRSSINKQRKFALKSRISSQPQATDFEYLLGAFIEMYEPYLKKIVRLLYEKGYAIDVSSGFGSKNAEFQVMTGNFSIDYVTKNKLEKIGVKFREYNGSNSLIFWPEEATLESINTIWMKIIEALPNKGKLTAPSTGIDAILFRRKYIPEDLQLRKQRLFERLKFNTLRKVSIETKRRQKENSHPNKIESILGLFIEEIEPQVRQAVIEMNKKGYATDKSGFMDNSCDQMIEGDFQLDNTTIRALEAIGVQVDTNPSGYTRLQFSPLEADIAKIKRKWHKIISLLPNKNQMASVSMTRKAREFRLEFQ